MKLLEQRRMGALFFAYAASWSIARPGNALEKYLPAGYGFHNLACNNDEVRWLFDEDNLRESGKKLVEIILRQPQYFNLLVALFELSCRINNSFCEKISAMRLLGRKKEDIVGIIDEGLGYYYDAMGLGLFAELLDFYLSYKTKEELEQRGLPPNETQKAISLLSTPEEETFSRQAEKSILKIAAVIQSKGSRKNFFGGEINEMIENHKKDFYWSTTNYFSFSGMGKKSIKQLVKKALQSNKNAKEKIKEMDAAAEEAKKQKIALQEKLHLSKQTLALFGLLQKVAMVYDERKKAQMYSFFSLGRLIKELAKRQKTSFDLAKYLLPREIKDFSDGKILPQDLYARRQYCLVDFNKKPEKILLGEEARFAENVIWGKTVQNVTAEINGLCASAGKAVAKARVISSAKNLSELKKGEILVTGMTSPECVPVLGKAVGIITDDGGLTSHAAIIARELGIPAIVGTKIATKVIKTGDLVELRANHGLARIIERVEKIV